MNVRELDPAPLVVGAFMALAGVLFLAQPLVQPIVVGGVDVPIAAVSFVVLAFALDLGAVLFYWQGDSTAAMVHGVAGLGWTLLVVGTALGGGLLWLLGLAVVVGGAVFLFVEMNRREP
ncbi:hypothetical protein [Salinibaculum rarum]|uniref:hypothetical protein n=1 Tax=Salinibaculum rarum TaxID=3058903 RepID=UPI00265E1875|nr:hypothetical protein [Salinibaculum sp. KK48]